MINEMKEYVVNSRPVAKKEATIAGDCFRISVLTNRLIRLEYNSKNQFIDEPTQIIRNRDFEVPEFRVIDGDALLEIVTDELHLFYDKNKFSPEGLWITLEKGYGVYGSTWNYGEKLTDLKGTARTLDNADGAIELEQGLMSRDGYTVIDDSKTAILDETGWICPRNNSEGIDIYFLGYGHDYLGCLKDFYHLCGETPLLPRYLFGNWWSRFYRYNQDEYISLMKKFKSKDIPFSAAVIDMDWHKTNLLPKYGSGWTGYSWNRELFYDPQKFLADLHEMGLAVTLNLHPADGIKGHEDNYLPMAKEMGVDYENEERIPFDVTSKKFMDNYFRHIHHPHEKDGVDFWWIDWQQGSVTRTPGIDALWMLNHLHYLDHGRDGKRPVTFSRYAGIGSHRYPIGFSGDTVNTWKSLDFQPYFTSNASNAGYTWWSHDIGGHMRGQKDDELATRWIQYGVFSPIMRLHSTSNPFYGKEMWNYGPEAEMAMTKFMQLRHKLIPYIYTANYATNKSGIPLIMPLYYKWDVNEAYNQPNEYIFGSEMIVSPITSPMNKKAKLAYVKTWLPEGTYYDLFTGNVYKGGRSFMAYRSINSIPVFVKAGGIVPLALDYMDTHKTNPEKIQINVYHGENGQYTMIEDDCQNMQTTAAVTKSKFTYTCGKESNIFKFERECEKGNLVIPENREYVIKIFGLSRVSEVKKEITGRNIQCDWYKNHEDDSLEITIAGNDISNFSLEILVEDSDNKISQPEVLPQAFSLLNSMQISYDLKQEIYSIISSDADISIKATSLLALSKREDAGEEYTEYVYGSIMELLTLGI